MSLSRSGPRAFRAPRVALALGLATAVVAGAGISQAVTRTAATPADPSEHGGAQRLDGDQTAAVAAAVRGGEAQNVILLIGDGMGDSEITIARNYAEGAAGRLAGIDALPLTGQYTTYSLDKTTHLPDYVPDSAATGSTWATGTKTYDNAISVDVAGTPQQTILELAKLNGLKTGDVTTAEIQDATPAVLVSHISARSCYGPSKTSTTCPAEALENGGPGSITEQLLDTRPDVTLGGGAATFAETAKAGPYQGQTLAEQATARGYRTVTDAAGLAAVTRADQDTPLLGLFASGNFVTNYSGPAAVVGGAKADPVACTPNSAKPDTQPSLAAMTDKAIGLLRNRNGFFLQVEGASIDKRDHAADACGQIGETVDFDAAVRAALDFAERDGHTSVFVTADHGHSSQIIEPGSTSPGLSVNLLTTEGAPMAINYGTAPSGGSQQHTGTQVRLAGYGPQAANVVGLTDDTDLYFTMRRALGLVDDPAGSSAGATLKVGPERRQAGLPFTVRLAGFDGDRTATVVVKGRGTTLTRTVALSGGKGGTTVTGKKPGRYAVTVVGDQTGAKASDSFVVAPTKKHHR